MAYKFPDSRCAKLFNFLALVYGLNSARFSLLSASGRGAKWDALKAILWNYGTELARLDQPVERDLEDVTNLGGHNL